jgi:hypothetical protein
MEKFATDLAKLKELLQTADNFGDIVKYFFDHLANDPTFIKLSKPTKHSLVKETLRSIATRLFKQDAPVTNLLLLKLSKHQFYHGACFIQGRPANVLYFEDIDMGIVCTASTYPYMEYARFTCYRLKELDKNSIFKAGSRSIN